MKIINMKGKHIGDLTVKKFSHTDDRNRAYWICKCDVCGCLVKVRGDNLRRGTGINCSWTHFLKDTYPQKTKNA